MKARGSVDFAQGHGQSHAQKLGDAQSTQRCRKQTLEKAFLGKSGSASREKVAKAINTYVKYLTKKGEDMGPALAQLVGHSGRTYLLGMHLLEQHALFTKLTTWANHQQ